jgi:hypothetical protein
MLKLESMKKSQLLYGRIAQISKIETANGGISGKSG